jgi:glycosyltransferase involved in cell wall biosynthesis
LNLQLEEIEMKVLHIVPGLDDPTCGIAVAAKMIARRQRASGKSVECVDFKAWTTRQIADADEVWVHSMWTPGVMMAAWMALRLGKTLVRMPHGCMDPVKVRHHWWKKMWVTPFEKWLFRRLDSVIATCEDEAKWIKDFEHLVKKVEMLSLGECVDFSRVERVERVGDADGSLRLLFIGRLHPLKGVEFLLGAMNDLLSQRCREAEKLSLELRIIGKDEGEGDKLRQMAKDYGLDVEFCGVVSDEEKEKAWDWCDILVLPTLSENFGLVVAEALERGKRVITTDGAPAWGVGLSYVDCVEGGEILIGYGGRLVYLKGYREGMMEKRVALLKKAIEIFGDNY